MKKHLFILLSLILTANFLYAASNLDSLSNALDKVIHSRQKYIEDTEENIKNIKKQLLVDDLTFNQEYNINLKLMNMYSKYQLDSAIFYTQRNKMIAATIKDETKIIESDLNLASFYSAAGMYIESKDILSNIDRKTLNKKQTSIYYETYSLFLSHYGQSNGKHVYFSQSELYRDSLLSILDPSILDFKIKKATKYLYEGKKKDAEALLISLLENTTDKDPQRALIAYLLGCLYHENKELQLQYFTISAITDIINCIKNNASLHNLSVLYYEMGNVDQANRLMGLAMEDAMFCNVKYRTIENFELYHIINASYQTKKQQQQRELQKYLYLISILSFILILGIIYIYKQMKRVAKIRKELYRMNEKLSESNLVLSTLNENLSEANLIKEEYIAQFFNICSSYIDKLEDYRKMLNKKAANKELEALYKILKSDSIIETELEELYKKFDEIFLNIYPTFVEELNNLLIDTERIYPKQGELLNTELRIFALIRLGITDSVKIAHFLRYSLRTVYNYRTKVRNKASVPRDEFEEYVKTICSFHKKDQNFSN